MKRVVNHINKGRKPGNYGEKIMKHWTLCSLLAVCALAFLTAGCVDNSIPDDMPPLPPAQEDVLGGAGTTDLSRGGAWGDGADSSSVAGANGDWAPVDPGNNLGFPIVYFGFDTDELAPGETAKLDKVAGYLLKQASLGLIIEGHCDQRGTEEYNRALGDRRANSIRSYLVGAGIEDARIKTISYGADRPAMDGSGESVWSKNRRGVLVPARMK